MADSDADPYDPDMPPASDSGPGSVGDDEQSLSPPDMLGEHSNQLHWYHEVYAEYLNKRNKKRRSLSIEGIDSSDGENGPIWATVNPSSTCEVESPTKSRPPSMRPELSTT